MQQMLEQMAQQAPAERLDLKTAAQGILNLRSALLPYVIEGFESDLPMLSVRLNMIDTIINEIVIRFLDLQRNPPHHQNTGKTPDIITRSWDSRPVNPPETSIIDGRDGRSLAQNDQRKERFRFFSAGKSGKFPASLQCWADRPTEGNNLPLTGTRPLHRSAVTSPLGRWPASVVQSRRSRSQNHPLRRQPPASGENLLAFPISSDPAHIYGTILACNPTEAPPFEQEMIVTGQIIARALGLAQENRLLYDETRKRLVESSGLRQITLALLQKLELPEVLEIVCSEAQRLTNAMGSSVSLLENEKWLRIAFQTGTASCITFP